MEPELKFTQHFELPLVGIFLKMTKIWTYALKSAIFNHFSVYFQQYKCLFIFPLAFMITFWTNLNCQKIVYYFKHVQFHGQIWNQFFILGSFELAPPKGLYKIVWMKRKSSRYSLVAYGCKLVFVGSLWTIWVFGLKRWRRGPGMQIKLLPFFSSVPVAAIFDFKMAAIFNIFWPTSQLLSYLKSSKWWQNLCFW